KNNWNGPHHVCCFNFLNDITVALNCQYPFSTFFFSPFILPPPFFACPFFSHTTELGGRLVHQFGVHALL
ncbi:MAG: hypothetical protein MUF15_19590, partial [Acidobacteria bacterium]|nr:hypothetical protein [Acidobacteriota bacterium]